MYFCSKIRSYIIIQPSGGQQRTIRLKMKAKLIFNNGTKFGYDYMYIGKLDEQSIFKDFHWKCFMLNWLKCTPGLYFLIIQVKAFDFIPQFANSLQRNCLTS